MLKTHSSSTRPTQSLPCFNDLRSQMTVKQIRERIAALSNEHAYALLHSWEFWARPEQRLPSGEWPGWLILAGRGWGKTRVGSETTRAWARTFRFVNIIAATADD